MHRISNFCGWPAVILLAGGAVADNAPACESGRVDVQLHGTIAAELAWEGEALTCTGMPRPGGEGARLRFGGTAPGGAPLAIIVALPALQAGRTLRESPATVTIIDEDHGRFFSNADKDVCWSDVIDQRPVGNRAGRYRIRGRVYCVAPLAELGGSGGVAFTDLEFAGLLDWKAPQ